MKLLLVYHLEVQIEHCGREYLVNSYFIIWKSQFIRLGNPIYNIDECGNLLNYPWSIYLRDKPIGLFRFDNYSGTINCWRNDLGKGAFRVDLSYFGSDTHFFVLKV